MAKLYCIPTPIGNLKDITFRALEVLKVCDIILAEDTRTTGNLLRHFEIQKPLKAYHLANEHKVLNSIIQELEVGKTLALVSDAGTPAISDPGFLLVREAIKNNVEVECLPGATAFVPALVVSGLTTNKFVFEGFLPNKKGRATRIAQLKEEERTIIFYESPYRIGKLLSELEAAFGPKRHVAVCRELSKMYEEIKRGTLEELVAFYAGAKVKGEIVLVVEGYNTKQEKDENL